MYELDKVYEEIIEQQYTWCKVVAGKKQVLLITNRGGHINLPIDCKNKLKKFCDKNPGVYMMGFKVRPNDPEKNSTWFEDVSVNMVGFENATKGMHISTPVNEAKLRKEIRAQVLAEEKQKKDDAMVKETKDKIIKEYEALQTFAGKLGAFITTMMNNGTHPNYGNLKGTTTMLNNGQNSTLGLPLWNDAVDPNQMSPVQTKKANDSLVVILHSMSPEVLEQFAIKVQQKPEIVNQLKALL